MFAIMPYHAEVSMARMPYANWILIGVTSLIAIFMFSGGFSPTELEELNMMLSQENFSLHQLVTHQFLHGDWWHLLGNMIFLWVFGNAVNARLGHWLFILIYLAGGAFSGLMWLKFGHGYYLLGASGAITGIAGMFAAYYPMKKVRIFYFVWLFFIFLRRGTFSVPGIWLVMLFFILDLIGTLYGSGGGIAHIAHIAGAAHGFGLACLLLKYGLTPEPKHKQNMLAAFGIRDREYGGKEKW